MTRRPAQETADALGLQSQQHGRPRQASAAPEPAHRCGCGVVVLERPASRSRSPQVGLLGDDA
jgi:hypothetical protein